MGMDGIHQQVISVANNFNTSCMLRVSQVDLDVWSGAIFGIKYITSLFLLDVLCIWRLGPLDCQICKTIIVNKEYNENKF